MPMNQVDTTCESVPGGRWRRWLVPAAVLAFGILSSACKSLPTIAKPDVPLWVHHPGSSLSVFARRALTPADKRNSEAYERAVPALDPAHRRVFVGSSDGGFYALAAPDLSTLWRFRTAGAVHSEPLYVLAEDAVYFGSNDGAVYKLRASDGHMLWRFASAAEVSRKPVLDGDTLLVVNANDTLVAINKDSGKLRWYQAREPAAGMEISGYSGPAVHGGRVYLGFSSGVVMAYEVGDGREAWAAPIDLTVNLEQAAGDEVRYFDVDTTPRIAEVGARKDPYLFVASYEGGVFALDARTGAQIWNNDGATGVTELTLWRGRARPRRGAASAWSSKERSLLIACSGLSGVWAFDLESGKEVWRRDLPEGGVTGATPWSGALLVGTTRYGSFLLHPVDGGVLDGIHSGGAFAATPASYRRRAYILSNEGVLFGLSIQTPSRGL